MCVSENWLFHYRFIIFNNQEKYNMISYIFSSPLSSIYVPLFASYSSPTYASLFASIRHDYAKYIQFSISILRNYACHNLL